jgi:hypothetical protein
LPIALRFGVRRCSAAFNKLRGECDTVAAIVVFSLCDRDTVLWDRLLA